MTTKNSKPLDSDNVAIEGGVQRIDPKQPEKAVAAGNVIDTEPVLRTEAFDEIRFMREPVTIIVADAMDESEPPFAEVTVNGNYAMIHRGVEQTITRAHLAVLAQAKQARVRQKKTVQNDGAMGFQEELVAKLTFPFQLVEDKNPKGRDWLRQLLANPV